jgi:hypothetical protein
MNSSSLDRSPSGRSSNRSARETTFCNLGSRILIAQNLRVLREYKNKNRLMQRGFLLLTSHKPNGGILAVPKLAKDFVPSPRKFARQ